MLGEVASAAVGSVLAQPAVTLTQLAQSRCLTCFQSRSNGNHFWCVCKSYGAREVDGVSLPRRIKAVWYRQLWMYARRKVLNTFLPPGANPSNLAEMGDYSYKAVCWVLVGFFVLFFFNNFEYIIIF